jgi:hypothetical protein
MHLRFLFTLALLALAAVPYARARTSIASANCDDGGALDFEVGFQIQTTERFRVTIENASQGVVDSRIADPNIQIGETRCHWVAHVGEANLNPLERVKFNADTLHTLRFERLNAIGGVVGTYTYSYLLCRTPNEPGDPRLVGDFYCPVGTTLAYPDLLFYWTGATMRVYPTKLFTGGVGDVNNHIELAEWVLPYNARNVCEDQGNCGGQAFFRDIPFVSEQVAPPYTVSELLTLEVYNGLQWNFTSADVTSMAFVEDARLNVYGTLAADGVTFTAAPGCGDICDPGPDDDGTWGGIAFLTPSGSGLTVLPASTLIDSQVEHVGPPTGGSRALTGAVGVFGRDVTLSGTQVHDSEGGVMGLLASGAANVLVTDGSLIYENDGGGALAASGADLTINAESRVEDNPGGGVAASGYGSTLILDGATVQRSNGPGTAQAPGVRALFNAQVEFVDDDPEVFVQVLDNDGGLDAQSGGSLDGGTCPGQTLPCPSGYAAVHQIQRNAPGGAFFDARSQGGASVIAEGNDWGVTSYSALVLVNDGSTLDVCPMVGITGACGGAGRIAAGVADGLRGSEDVFALVEAAERAYLAGDMAAFELAADAVVATLGASATEDERRAAFEGTTRLFAWAQPSGPLASLANLAAQPGEAQPWAMRALGVGRASAEQYVEARATADTLAVTYAGSEHARFGLGLRVRVAVAEEDEVGAVTAIDVLVAAFPEAEEVPELAALVLATFPEAGVEAVLNGRSPAGAMTTAPVAASVSPGALLDVETARPNPTTSSAFVPFELAEEATVEAVLYDALGRRMAVLASGAFGAGHHAVTLDGGDLPAGVYVVHVTARSGAGAPVVAVRRVTLMR